jgi:hypothetical protein
MVIGFGAITAGLMLISPVAVTGAALSLLAAAFLPALERNGWRDAAGRVITFAASFAATFLLLWFLTGQTLGGLIPWARYSASIVSGYAAAMNRTGTVFPHAQIVAAVVVVVLTVTVVWWRSSGIPQVRRSGALALYLVLCFLVFKHGFVRQGDGHVLGFFEFAAMAPLAFLPWLRLRLAAALVSFGLVAVLALYLTFGAVFDGWTTIREAADSIARSYAPSPHIESLTDTIHLATSAEERSATAREGRANIVRLSKFPGDLSAFEGQTVHISPWDASLQYALQGTTWDPAPVFQDYAAYTTALDELNADWFDGPDAADVVLRRPGHAIDNRLPRWEPPSATLSILCHYRSGQEMTGWIVLQHLERSRCGEPESAGSAETTMGETFRPPAAMPATLLVARFSGIADGPADRLLATAFRAPEIQVETANSRSWRFLQGTQGSWHVISAPDCALTTLDGGTQLDMSSLRFWSKGGPGTAITEALSDSKIQVEYASIPFSC